jgi:hypothetical protein
MHKGGASPGVGVDKRAVSCGSVLFSASTFSMWEARSPPSHSSVTMQRN